MVDMLRPKVELVCYTIIFIAIIIQFACLKWMQLFDLMVFEVLLWQMTLAFIPSDEYSANDLNAYQLTFIIFVMGYTMRGSQIIACVLVQLIWMIVPSHLIYQKPLTFQSVGIKVGFSIFQFIL